MQNSYQSQQKDFYSIDNEPKVVKISSEFLQRYSSQLQPQIFDQDAIANTLRCNRMAYNPHLEFQPFTIEIERIALASESVQVLVKFGLFILAVSAHRVNSNNFFRNLDNIQGSYGTIYFTRYEDQQLCFKSFPFKNEKDFVKLFRKVVKEWSILKICSVLECGPFMDNYFGFDLLIYDDCIQYATEKGDPLASFGALEAKQLKKQLSLMHHLHIIHYDIKPENIIFSRTYQKPVFIDFGLSQIIEEQLGFKTFAGFRGTPNYCCPQMVALMMEDRSFVDLYYNDCYSLEATIAQMCNELVTQNLITQQISIDQKHYSTFPLIAFQYHYLNNNLSNLQKILNLLKENRDGIKRVLNFIKQLSSEMFLSNFFRQNLIQFSQYAQYQQISNKVKNQTQKIFFDIPSSDEAFQGDYLLNLISNHQSQTEDQKLGGKWEDYHRLASIIFKLQKFEEKNIWNYLNISFYCIRFDARNLSVQEKKVIAKKIVDLLSSFHDCIEVLQDNSISQIKQIKHMFRTIFQFCLENPCKKSKELIFSICQQMILCDIDLSAYIEKLFAFLEFSFTSPEQQLLVVLECAILTNILFIVQSQQMDKTDEVYQKIETYRNNKQQRIKADTYQNISQQISAIMNILTVLVQPTTIQLFSFYRQLQKLKSINNIKIKQHLLHLLTFKQIQMLFYESTNTQVLSMARFVKQCWKYRKIAFFGYVNITTTLLNLSFSQTDLQNYSNVISKTINCKQISDRIQFHTFFSDFSCSQAQFNSKISKLTKYYERLNTISQEGDYKLHEIIQYIICQDIKINPQLLGQLQTLYKIFRHFNDRNSKVCQNMVQCYYQIWWRSEVQFFFFKLSQETQELFLQNTSKADQQFRLYANEPSKQAEMVFYSFKRQVYRCKYFLHQQEYATCLRILEYLIRICQALNIHFLCLQVYKLMNRISMVLMRDSELSVSHACHLYQFCKFNSDLSFYLFEMNSSLTFRTLYIFAVKDETLFREFVMSLVDLLGKNPIPSYFIALISAIDTFSIDNPARKYLLHYDQLGCNRNTILLNPYYLIFCVYSLSKERQVEKPAIFKIIVSNVDALCLVAKRWVLSRYYFIQLLFLRNIQRKRYFAFRQGKLYLYNGKQQQQRAYYKSFYRKNRKKSNTYATQMFKKKIALIIKYLLTK